MQSKEFAAPFEKVMILQIVLNLKKRLQELPSAGYALSGRKAEHTFYSASNAARRRCLANCTVFWPHAEARGKQVRKMAQQGR